MANRASHARPVSSFNSRRGPQASCAGLRRYLRPVLRALPQRKTVPFPAFRPLQPADRRPRIPLPLNEHWQVPHQEGHQLAGSDLGRGAHFPSHRRCSPPLTFLICVRCRRSTTTSRPARWRGSSSKSTCTTGTSWVRGSCRCVK